MQLQASQSNGAAVLIYKFDWMPASWKGTIRHGAIGRACQKLLCDDDNNDRKKSQLCNWKELTIECSVLYVQLVLCDVHHIIYCIF